MAPALAAAPAVGLMIYFMTLSVPTGGGWGLPSLAECAQKLQRFLTLYHAFVAYQRSEILFSFILAIALTFAALAMLAIKLWLRRWSRCDGLLAVAAVWFLIYMAAPQAVGEGYYLFHRLTPLPLPGAFVVAGRPGPAACSAVWPEYSRHLHRDYLGGPELKKIRPDRRLSG